MNILKIIIQTNVDNLIIFLTCEKNLNFKFYTLYSANILQPRIASLPQAHLKW